MKKLMSWLVLLLVSALLIVIYELHSNKLKSEFIQMGQKETEFIKIKSFSSDKKPKNIIFLVGDGAGLNQISVARLALGGPDFKLAIDQMPYSGFSLTHSEDNIYTDSAAAATTWATGIKTTNKFLAMNSKKKSFETIPEMIALKGFLSGLVATSSITHATPAAFYAHVDSRYKEEEIARQLIESPIYISFGGGTEFFDLDALKSEFNFIDNKEDLFRSDFTNSKKIIGLFDTDGIVRSSQNPTQQEMTKKAINLLSSKTKSF